MTAQPIKPFDFDNTAQVTALQQALGINNPSGAFDPATQQALRSSLS